MTSTQGSARGGTGVVVADAERDGFPIIDVDPAFERLTGYTAAELVGRSCSVLQGPRTDPLAVERIASALRHGCATTVTLLNYRKDGSAFWNRLTLAPVHEEGRLVRVIGVQTDVSAALETGTRFSSVLDALTEGVVVHDAAGSIQAVNPSAERILGMSEGQLTGTCATDHAPLCVHEDGTTLLGHEHPATIALRTGARRASVVLGVRRPDGELRWVDFETRPVFADADEPAAIVTTLTDVTERRRDEERSRDLVAQTGLRRLATAVAEQAPFAELCEVAAEHAASSVGAVCATVGRFVGDAHVDVTAVAGSTDVTFPTVGVIPYGPASLPACLRQGGDAAHRRALSPDDDAPLVAAGYTSAASVPIRVEGDVWGVLGVFGDETALPADVLERLESFGRLIGVGVEAQRQRARLALQASTDAQTGVLNHHAFHARLDEEVGRACATVASSRWPRSTSTTCSASTTATGTGRGDDLLAAVAAGSCTRRAART
jgi:PAS domain S-box-containing protein